MENSNERFENEWKEAFDNAEEEPNSSLWQNLENKLAEKEILIYKQKYFYLRRIAAVLLILLIPLTVFFVYESGLKNDDEIIIEKRVSDNSPNNKKPPLNNEDAEIKSNNISSTNYPNKITASEDKALFNDNPNEKASEREDNSTHNILRNQSINNSPHEIKNPGNNLAKNTPSNINPNKNSKNSESEEENKALYSGSSKVSEEVIDASEANTDKLKVFSKTEIRMNGETYDNENKKLTTSINEDKTKHWSVNPKEISKKNKSLSYSEEIQKSSSLQEDRNRIDQNSVENSVDKRNNSPFAIDYLNSKGPILDNTHRQPLALKLEEYELNQEVVPQKDGMRRWFASVDFTPTYTNQNFERPSTRGNVNSIYNSPGLAMDVVNQLDVLIKPDFSFNSGLGVGYRLNKRLYIESGLKYTYNQSIVMTNLFYTNRDNSTKTLVFNKVLKNEPAENPLSMESLVDAKYSSYNQVANSFGIKKISTINIYTQYLTVPLTLNYKVIDRRFNLSLGGGLATDFFLQYRSKEDKENNVEKEKIEYYDNGIFRKVAFSLLLNAELEYEVSNKYGIYLRPVYKGSLHSYTDRDKLKNRPNSTGVSFGIRYNFK